MAFPTTSTIIGHRHPCNHRALVGSLRPSTGQHECADLMELISGSDGLMLESMWPK